MNHPGQPSTKELILYLEGDLSHARSAEIKSHLQQCSQCQEQLRRQRRLIQSLGELDADLNSVDLVPAIREAIDTEERTLRKKGRWMQIMVVVIGSLLLLGGLLYYLLT